MPFGVMRVQAMLTENVEFVVEDGAPDELLAREGSRYGELLARERNAHEVWERWKHVRIVDGRLEEGA